MATRAQKISFIAALTATDQLSPTERKRHAAEQRAEAKQALRDDRYEAWMMASAAYHRAKSASLLACLARRHNHADKAQRNLDEVSSVATFIELADRYMLLPFANNDDRQERGVLLRRWKDCALTSSTSPLFDAAREAWIAYLGPVEAAKGKRR